MVPETWLRKNVDFISWIWQNLGMSVTSQLKSAREQQGRTVRDVADAAGLHENTLHSAEKRGEANLKTLSRWADALGYRVVLLPKDDDISSASKAI